MTDTPSPVPSEADLATARRLVDLFVPAIVPNQCKKEGIRIVATALARARLEEREHAAGRSIIAGTTFLDKDATND